MLAWIVTVALAGEEQAEPQAAVTADPWVASLEAWLVRDGAAPEEAHQTALDMNAFEDGVRWQTGRVAIQDGAIALALQDGDRYAGPEDTSRILEAWGNPPEPDTDGMIVPSGAHLFGPDSWAVLVRYSDEGWVDDSEAASIDYDEVLQSKKETEEQANEERRKLGLETLTLAGWAERPRYDAATRVLYWATLARTAGGEGSLNYDVRVLGRRGVLSLNAIAAEDALATVKAGMERVRTLASFEPGHTYTDYVAGVDEKAAYGIGALVAGGALAAGAKAGVFKGLLVLLLAGKKFVIAGVVALLAGARAFFGKKGTSDSTPSA